MHISLDSALGRQRRLNSVGESVLQIAPNAAAAYSLRSLTGGDPKVVRVRRDVDNAERDFTASGISSGALVDFATSGNGVFANTGYESFTNASASGFTASNTGSTGFAVSDILDGVSGDAVSVSFDIDITNGSPGISLRTALNGGSTASNGIVYTTSGSKTATLTGNKGYVGVGFTEGDAPSNFTVSNFKVLGNGFVETWYDQSGNSKDATQPTAGSQPKIVDEGSLVTGGIDFDGTDDIGLVTGSFSLTQTYSTFSVSHTDDASTSQGVWSTAASFDSTFNAAQLFRSDDGFSINSGTTLTTAGTINYVADRNYLQTNVVNGGSSSIFVDGATGATGNMGATNPSGVLILGYYKSGSNIQNLDGAIKELIIYDSDQTSNRAALETNIAAANGVTLS